MLLKTQKRGMKCDETSNEFDAFLRNQSIIIMIIYSFLIIVIIHVS